MDIDGKSLDITQDNLAKLKQLFPNLVKEGEIDLNEFKAAFGQEPASQEERYGLSWAGKYDSFKQVQEQTTHTLNPDRDNSIEFDPSENIFIEGENLDALQILQRSYYGKIKMIYIDPPYNTGNDHFVYPDNFAEDRDEYLQRNGEKDRNGDVNRADLFRKNIKENGHFHSNWLSMMYPRIYLARNLLREDGVIFVSIDDNEVANLRLLMDQVFGEENFFAKIVVQSNKRGQTYKQISKTHEYLLVYTRNAETEVNELKKSGEKDDLNFSDNIGRFNIRELRNRNPKFGRFNRPNLFYPIYVNAKVSDKDGLSPISLIKKDDYSVEVLPLNSNGGESCWRWGKDLVQKNIGRNTLNSNVVARKKNNSGYNIYEKYRKLTYKAKSIWFETEVLTEKGTIELRKLGLADYFDFPKPVYLIKKLLMLGTDQEDIILDFFAGSATTAHAVLDLNKEDGGNRKFICIQYPEETPENSPARNAGYNTIADIGRARIRKVIEQMNAERAAQLPLGERPTLGFRAFKLAPSNFKIWRSDLKTGAEIMAQLEFYVDPTLHDNEEYMLWELLLKAGYPLSAKVKARQIEGVTVYDVENGQVMVALQALNPAVIETVRQSKPQTFICLDKLFNNDNSLKTNTGLQMKEDSITFQSI